MKNNSDFSTRFTPVSALSEAPEIMFGGAPLLVATALATLLVQISFLFCYERSPLLYLISIMDTAIHRRHSGRLDCHDP